MYDYYFENDIEVNTIDDIINYITNNYTYKDEQTDYWQLPEETYRLKTGDCEDLALLFCYLLETKLDIRTNLIIIAKNTEVHILANYNDYYTHPISGYTSKDLSSGWNITFVIPYPEAIWMTYYYHNNVGKYQ
jgi:hypothetical protein